MSRRDALRSVCSRHWGRALVLGAFLLAGTVYFAPTICVDCRPYLQAWDFAVNWTAAHRLRRDLALYDPAQSRTLAQQLVGDWTQALFQGPLDSYTNPPSTALLFL